MTRSFLTLPLLAFALSGCGTAVATHRAAKPTEVETREAYLGTPVIVDEQGAGIPIGANRPWIRRKLGYAAITYRRSIDGVFHDCLVYPINGTQRWDRYGSPVADEWEFCFDRRDRLLTRRRIRAPKSG